jgi:hypothetical protein
VVLIQGVLVNRLGTHTVHRSEGATDVPLHQTELVGLGALVYMADLRHPTVSGSLCLDIHPGRETPSHLSRWNNMSG